MLHTHRSSVILPTLLTLSLVALPLGAQADAARDSAAVIDVAEQFHAFLSAGDSAAALALLSDGVQILESGGIEDRAHYREHHLAADIAYAKTAPSQRTVHQVRTHGDAAWVASTSITTVVVNGREEQSLGAELMVLTRTPQGWRIAAIHWSSRRRS